MAEWVVMGRVSGLHGLQGWVKLFSHTQPRESIAHYDPLYLHIQGQWQPLRVEAASAQGGAVIVRFAGFSNRDEAAALLGCDIAIQRRQLPPLEPGEYYWTDLQGLRVVTVEGIELGTVERLFETGANDVIVVKGERERLIPFLRGEVILEIDLERGLMKVDWDPAF